MGTAIGDILPLALGVAISPIPIIAVILMLLSPKARTNGPAFLVGWVAGLAGCGHRGERPLRKRGAQAGAWVWAR